MTKEEAIKRLIDECCKYRLYCELYPDACMKEECEIYMAIEALKERPKGEWVYEEINSYTDRTYCSECGSQAPFVYVADDHYGRLAHGETRKTNFCPNCGADMRGGETVPLYFKRGADDGSTLRYSRR